MQKVLKVVLIISLIIGILATPLFFKINGEVTFERSVNSVFRGSSSNPTHTFDFVVDDYDTHRYRFWLTFSTNYNDTIDEYIQGEIKLRFSIDDGFSFLEPVATLPIYYRISNRLYENNTVVSYEHIDSIALRFDFLSYLATLQAFQQLTPIYNAIDGLYEEGGVFDAPLEIFEFFQKFAFKTDITIVFLKAYFNFFTLKGVE